jgi:BatD DUF11 like domain
VRWAWLLWFVSAAAFANDLNVDRRTVTTNDLVTITVSLEGPFAVRDSVSVPLENLTLVGEPWVSSEFSWINGEVVRRKVFRYRARPIAAGPASAGPLTLQAEGQRATLPQMTLQVIPERTSGTNEPELVLDELIATGRDPFFVTARTDKQTVYVGEQIVVTWTLYNAANLQQLQMTSVPKLPDFWAEEIDVRRMSPQQELMRGMVLHRTPMRRVALFPLRTGRFRIGGITLDATVMRFNRSGSFRMFEGNLVEVSTTSAPVAIDVQPIPPGPPVDAVGELTLDGHAKPQLRNGPLVVEVTLAGRGNVRAAPPPRFAQRVPGDVQIESDPVVVEQEEHGITMSRKWRYLIFPSATGTLTLPPLTMRIFDPTLGQRRDLSVVIPPIEATVAEVPSANAEAPAAVQREAVKRRAMPWVTGGILAVLFVAFAGPRVKREALLRRNVREIVAGTPSEIRERIDQRVDDPAALLAEKSERGDAYRALRSMLSAAEGARDIAADADDEIERRVRDVLRALKSRG